MELRMFLVKFTLDNGDILRLPYFFQSETAARRFCKAVGGIYLRELDPNNFSLMDYSQDNYTHPLDDYDTP